MDLQSCLLVNPLWCKVSVRILWKSIRNYNTLIACLPNESKEILHKNEIIVSTTTSNPPSFNYVSFIKNLSIKTIALQIKILLGNQSNTSRYLFIHDNKFILLMQEIFKMFASQTSLKELNLCCNPGKSFLTYPRTMDYLGNLSNLSCNLHIDSEFFYRLS